MSDREAWLDLFAAALERELPVDRAAAMLGKSASWGAAAFKEICARQGPQALELDLGWRPVRKAA